MARIDLLAPVCLFALTPGLCSAGAGTEASRADFEEELVEVRELIDARKWKRAGDVLADALAAHEDRDHVLVHWPEIEENLARIRFWSSYDEPEPEDVVQGELVSWNPRSGAIKLRYESGDEGLAGSVQEGRAGDFIVPQDGVFLHPLLFKGRYSLEVRGDGLGANNKLPGILVAWNWSSLQGLLYGEAYAVVFGEVTGILRLEGGEYELLDSCGTGIKYDRPYRFKVSVAGTGITASYNEKSLLRMQRESGEFGQFGLTGFDHVEEVIVVGEVEPSWIAGLLDARIQADWTEFLESFDPVKEAPAWLAARVEGEAKSASDFGLVLPGTLPDEATEARERVGEAARYFEKGQFANGLKYVESIADDGLPEGVRRWLRAVFHAYTGKLGQALDELEPVVRDDPAFFEGRLLEVQLVQALRTSKEADQALAGLVADFPDYIEPYEEQVQVHLFRGRRADAVRVLEEAVANGIPARSLVRIGKNLLRAERGPSWGERFVHETKNFVIASDMGRKACLEIGAELEDYFREYNHNVRRIQERGAEKSEVYFFSGRRGYEAYTRDLLGHPAENTLGLYSPALKQLLIWNSPDKRMVMRTVRHEGFHQYLDRLLEVGAPVWLNEGLAEYFEQAHYERARWKADQVNEQHVAILQATREDWTPLEELVYIDNRAFRANSELHYPQSWALVHYLQNGGREPARHFNALLDALIEGVGREEALTRAFADVDWDAFEREFRDYVAQLQ